MLLCCGGQVDAHVPYVYDECWLMCLCSQPLKEAEVKSLEKALKGFMKESKVLKLERKVRL